MKTYLCLVLLLLTCLGSADDKTDYQRRLAEVQEQKKLLNETHRARRYSEAPALQESAARKSEETLKFARASAEIPDDVAWMAHIELLRDIGYSDQALTELDSYLRLPLDLRKQMEGWKRRAQVLRGQRNFVLAQSAYEKAYSLAEQPLDEFTLRRELAGMLVAERQIDGAQSEIEAMEALLERLDEAQQLRASRDLQNLLARVYKEQGDRAAAHQAKLRELQLRRELLDREIQELEKSAPME